MTIETLYQRAANAKQASTKASERIDQRQNPEDQSLASIIDAMQQDQDDMRVGLDCARQEIAALQAILRMNNLPFRY